MDKKILQQGMSGITTRPRTTPKNVNKIQEEAKPSGERKVVSIAYADYKKIKNYANDHDMSITSAVSLIVENSTIL